MKQVLIYILVVFSVFSCTKDAVHHMEQYAVLDTKMIVTSNNTKFSANLSNYGNEEIIDHGFIWWGSRITGYWYYTEEELDFWIHDATDKELRMFLLNRGTEISLGKLEKPGVFTCEQDARTVLGWNFVMAYIKTNRYLLYSKVDIFENEVSLAWNRRWLSFKIPDDGQYFSVNGEIYIFYENTKIGKLDNANYQLVNKQQCPEHLNTFHFVIGENAYFSMNNRSMWKYTTTTDTWNLVSENPDIPYFGYSVISFTKDQKGYCTYVYNQEDYFIYEFDPETNIWTRKNKGGLPNYYSSMPVFKCSDQIYVFSGKELWHYDESLATFVYKTNIDIDLVYSILTINDKVYIVSQKGNTFDIFTYDLNNDETEKFCSLHNSFPNTTAISLVSNNKIIFLTPWQTCLYELDLSKME